ncbi:MAG: MarR family transcriptional regulator [Actinobacteria bacterium]|nr:MarR family transcriptional regulator [Actinomycetota bacterium]
MKHSSLLPLLRSQTQGDLLALLFINPEEEFSLSEVARRIKVSRPGVFHETQRLVAAGLITDRPDGRSRKIRANLSSPLSKPLSELLLLTYGPLPVLAKALSGIKDIKRAFLFGSWADRYQGIPGKPPNDVDVLIVGNVDLDVLEEVGARAESRLSKAIDFKRIRPGIWQAANSDSRDTSPLLSTILAGPMIEIEIEGKSMEKQ